jgi:hypothetical protein
MQKDVDVDNILFYQSTKFQLEIVYIWGCTKMTKSEKVIHNMQSKIKTQLH